MLEEDLGVEFGTSGWSVLEIFSLWTWTGRDRGVEIPQDKVCCQRIASSGYFTIVRVIVHDDSSATLTNNHRPRSLAHLYLEAQANGGFDALGGGVALQTLLCLAEPLVWHLVA